MNEKLIEQYKILHSKKTDYGRGIRREKDITTKLKLFLKKFGYKTILDFGCGKGALKDQLNKDGFICKGYDPAIQKFKSFPAGQVDCVVSTDVFEHLDQKKHY